jgi:DNA-binding GntR family transcriptional regulator
MSHVPRRPLTTREHAYAYLRDRILSRNMKSDTRLDLDAIARRLGVSRMPVREAVRQLASEGLLTIYPRRGVMVTALASSDILELFHVRAVLEGLAIRTALERGTIGPEEQAHLRRLADRLQAIEHEPVAWMRRHDQFHEYLCAQSNSPRLTAMIRNVRQSVEPHVRVFLSAYAAEMPGAEHRGLLAAIAEGDPAAAEQAMRVHVTSAATAIVSFLKRFDGGTRAEGRDVAPTARRRRRERSEDA